MEYLFTVIRGNPYAHLFRSLVKPSQKEPRSGTHQLIPFHQNGQISMEEILQSLGIDE